MERVERGIIGLLFQSLSFAVMRGSVAGKGIQPTRGPLSLKRRPLASDKAEQLAFILSSFG